MICMAAEDDEGDKTMCDPVDAPGGAMGDGDDGGDGNGGDDSNDDDDDGDDDDDDDDPEFDWTGLEENVPYVSGARVSKSSSNFSEPEKTGTGPKPKPVLENHFGPVLPYGRSKRFWFLIFLDK